MPELPEVETTLRGIQDALRGQTIERLVVREARLRWLIEEGLAQRVAGSEIIALQRRAKYILMHLAQGSLIWHLGMSGSMRLLDSPGEPCKHDHVDLVLGNGTMLRYNDPRRFGCLLWAREGLGHPLLRDLGPEPLDDRFNGEFLYQESRARRVAVKTFIMDQKVVVGVGNIYASEALFKAGIHPARSAQRISRARYSRLAEQIKQVLSNAIEQGGTTLRDFFAADGRPGYFRQQLEVYDRQGEPCPQCGRPVSRKIIGQRASFYCGFCQR